MPPIDSSFPFSAALAATVRLAAMPSQAPPAEHDAFSRSLRTFSRRGSLDILELLLRAPARFSEIRRALPTLAERLTWERLRELTGAGLIVRTVDAGPPITSTYAITKRGTEVHARLADLRGALREDHPELAEQQARSAHTPAPRRAQPAH